VMRRRSCILTFLPAFRAALFSLAAPESNILDEAELN